MKSSTITIEQTHEWSCQYFEFKRFIALSTFVRHLFKFPAPLHMGNLGAKLGTNCQDNDNRQVQDEMKGEWGVAGWLILHLLQRQQTINLFVSRSLAGDELQWDWTRTGGLDWLRPQLGQR